MLPKFLQSALWSYDLKKIDTSDKSDQRIIIEQILNYGTWKQLKWLVNTYSWEEIKQVVKNPSRGIWTEQSLNYWTKFCKIKLSAKMYNKSIMRLEPNF